MAEKYDSKLETLKHQKRVAGLMASAIVDLQIRAHTHDESKLSAAEKPLFDLYTPKLKGSTYGSEEYKGFLAGLKPALDHHYKHNNHHPEYHEHGIDDMTILDLFEMFFDWKAASERHDIGNIFSSILINKERFGMSDQLVKIFENTARKYSKQ